MSQSSENSDIDEEDGKVPDFSKDMLSFQIREMKCPMSLNLLKDYIMSKNILNNIIIYSKNIDNYIDSLSILKTKKEKISLILDNIKDIELNTIFEEQSEDEISSKKEKVTVSSKFIKNFENLDLKSNITRELDIDKLTLKSSSITERYLLKKRNLSEIDKLEGKIHHKEQNDDDMGNKEVPNNKGTNENTKNIFNNSTGIVDINEDIIDDNTLKKHESLDLDEDHMKALENFLNS